MTNEQLSASLSYLGDELLAECGARRQRPKRSWRTALIKAACIALVLFSGIYVAGRFDYSLGAGCASSPGTIADGRYYYHVRHSGVWCYDPAMGTSERVLSTFWYDGYAVNGYGIYYLRGETLYVQVGGGALAKTLLDRRKSRRRAKLEGDRELLDQARDD